MKFKIYDSIRYDTSGSLDDVVFFVRYGFEDSGSSAKAGVLNYESRRYFKQLDPVGSSEFENHNSLTSSSIAGWIQDGFGNGWGTFTSSIQSSITNALNSRSSGTARECIWWSTGSQDLNGELLTSGSSYLLYNNPNGEV